MSMFQDKHNDDEDETDDDDIHIYVLTPFCIVPFGM